MATLLFVHGTGVRSDAYDVAFDSMQRQMAHFMPGVKLAPCSWGDPVGAKLRDEGASVPSYDANRKDPRGGEREVRQREAVRWNLLYQDPLYEIRSMAALRPSDGAEGGEDDETSALAVSPLAAQPVADVLKRLRNVQFSEQVKEPLARAGHELAKLVPVAIRRLEDDPDFVDALESPGLVDPMARRLIVARAFVAAWMNAAIEADLPVFDGDLRDLMYAEVVIALGGAPKAIVDKLVSVFAGLVAWVGTPIARRKRTILTDAAFPGAADILLYQSRGEALRDYIAGSLRNLEAPVYILAHSLGGIAAFELLVAGTARPVAGLITAGSQAPFLYEMNALKVLEHGTALPASFPPWLNFFDLNDMLSYVGEGVFPTRVRDVELASRQPFPQSHSAYWTNENLWKEIKAFVK